jgi:phosphomannomutase
VSTQVSTLAPTAIHFGTDGWRAVISDEFTFANVRHVAQAIAEWILEQPSILPQIRNLREGENGHTPSVVVGFDTRFLSDRYAIEVTRVLAGNGLRVYLTNGNCPTPALSWAVLARGPPLAS